MAPPTTRLKSTLVFITKKLSKLLQCCLKHPILGHPPHGPCLILIKVHSGIELHNVVINVWLVELHERNKTKLFTHRKGFCKVILVLREQQMVDVNGVLQG